MSTTKRILGNYTLQSIAAGGQISLDASQVVINGNLVITGNSQSIVSTDSAITDHTITLNNGVTSPNPLGANIIVDRGTSPNVSIAWNETVAAWQITNNGVTYANIASVGSSLANVYGDSSPALGGNLFLNGHTIYSGPTKGNVQIYANTANSGGSGVYVTNDSTTGAELVTKAKAVAYSNVFGQEKQRAIQNTTLTTTAANIFVNQSSTGTSAITTIHLCNFTANTQTANIYAVPAGSLANTSTILYSNVTLTAYNTLIVSTENLILGCVIDAIMASASNVGAITATVSSIGI